MRLLTTFALVMVAMLLFSGCSTTRKQLDEINAKIAQTTEVVEQVQESLPEIREGLATAEETAISAAAMLEDLGTEEAAEIANKAAAEAAKWRQRLADAEAMVDTGQQTLALLQHQAAQIEVGEPWWLVTLKVTAGVALGAAGLGVPMAGRIRTVGAALSQTVKAVEVFRKDPKTDSSVLDVELAKAQSPKTKLQVKKIKG